MEIPPILKTNISKGNVVLMLGAGASMEATNNKGEKAPSAKKLGELLAKEFLTESCKKYPLNQISELAISESDLVTVQEYIRELLEPLEPTEAHNILTKFNWFGIATTNYDRLIEKAYSKCDSGRNVVPFIDNNDRIDDKLRDRNSIPYLKLHGCITRTTNERAPLILTIDQYVQYRDGRNRVFDYFKQWCYEHIIVFIGYSLTDPNLRQILLEVDREIPSRLKYFVVAPEFPKIVEKMWEKKNIDVIKGTFSEFMTTIEQEIQSPFRDIPFALQKDQLPIYERFTKKADLTEDTKQFIENEIEYVKNAKSGTGLDPRSFYKGMDLGWYPIINNLDVRRGLVDSILSDHFIDKESKNIRFQLIVIKAHAGAGKKTLLRRIAWDAANEYDCLCLYLKNYGRVSSAAIKELATLTQEKIFLFIEEITDRTFELIGFINNLGDYAKYITLVTSARTNEWNISCSELSEYVTNEYELRYLSHKDIDNLLILLEKHNALGTLKNLDAQQRKEALTQRAGRQLLVALHEATLGKSFVEIISDEYKKIKPFDAQKIYLSVCVLNRLGIPVRAGLISRIYNITFSDFKKRFFAPLEQIVKTNYNSIIRDYEYTARHQHIAEIIFEDVLYNTENKFNEYIKILQHLNISYGSDRKAFFQLIRANEIIQYFNDYSMGKRIYELGSMIAPMNQEVLHQMGIYEMKRPDGNINEAKKLLEQAYKLNENNHTVIHSIAELKVHLAEKARTKLEFDKYLDDAEAICLQHAYTLDSHGIATLIKSQLLKLEKILYNDSSETTDEELEHIVKTTESYLENGLQSYPGESHLSVLEAELAKLLSDSQRAVRALEKSFHLNPRNTYIAIRLSRCYQEQGRNDKEIEILRKAIEERGDKKELHYAFSKALLKDPNSSGETLEYHLKRSYTPGDKNYDAQLLHARQLFINGDFEPSKDIFNKLKYAKLPFKLKSMPRYPLETLYKGEICQIEATYAFIRRDGISDWIYCHEDNVEESIWRNLNRGTRVQFQLAFNMRGPLAINISLEI